MLATICNNVNLGLKWYFPNQAAQGNDDCMFLYISTILFLVLQNTICRPCCIIYVCVRAQHVTYLSMNPYESVYIPINSSKSTFWKSLWNFWGPFGNTLLLDGYSRRPCLQCTCLRTSHPRSDLQWPSLHGKARPSAIALPICWWILIVEFQTETIETIDETGF